MRRAQAISTAIYLIYIALLTFSLPPGAMKLDETGIIAAMRQVAPVLPVLLVAAALSAQFSAAVADTSGSGGLVQELTGAPGGARIGYGLLVAAGLVLTWTTDVFQIISHASRAFALYYALQAAIATVGAWRRGDRVRAALFAGATVLAALIVTFGRPVE